MKSVEPFRRSFVTNHPVFLLLPTLDKIIIKPEPHIGKKTTNKSLEKFVIKLVALPRITSPMFAVKTLNASSQSSRGPRGVQNLISSVCLSPLSVNSAQCPKRRARVCIILIFYQLFDLSIECSQTMSWCYRLSLPRTRRLYGIL